MAELDNIADVPWYLYRVTNRVNGKVYIGVTYKPEVRKKEHLYYKKANQGSLLKKAVNKYGPEEFDFEILCVGTSDYIYELEAKAIEKFDSIDNGYNLKPGGRGGLGHKVKSRSDDKPVFVSGFWFPNKRTAMKSMVITMNSYNHRQATGTLGHVVLERKSNSTALKVPNYFLGFWFPNLEIPSELFNIRPETIRQRILRGYFEEKRGKQPYKIVRKYMIQGKAYSTLEEASDELGIPKTTLKNKVSKQHENYGYTYVKEERLNWN